MEHGRVASGLPDELEQTYLSGWKLYNNDHLGGQITFMMEMRP